MKGRIIGTSALWLLALGYSGAASSELSYTFVDFRVISNRIDAAGTRSPTGRQQVHVDIDGGDGVSVAGSLSLPWDLYLHGAYNSSIIEHEARITSPFTEERVDDEFDLITSSFGFGYRRALTAGLDLTFELAYESGELDFGSLVGEDFDTERSGPAARLGVRWSPIDPFELYVSTGTSPYGKLELSDGELDDATVVNAGLRWYFFPDLAAGLDYRGGDLSMVTLSMRFGFGDLPW